MNYQLPSQIENSTCWVMYSKDNIYSWQGTTRTQWVRSGTQWLKVRTDTNSTNNNYNCMNGTKLEYEYSYNEIYYYGLAFGVIAGTMILLFALIFKPILRGSR